MEPTLYFAQRPSVPEAGTDEYDRWKRSSTMNFPGGYVESSYGNLIQTFAMTNTDSCSGEQVNVSRTSHQRVNTIGGESKTIGAKTFTYTKYPKRNSGGAAGGEVITITTSVGSYTARLGGDIQSFVSWLCGNGTSQLYDSIEFTSPRGAHYGPFAPIAAPAP